MKKSFKYFGLISASLLLVTACGTIPTLQNGEEAVVELKDEQLFSVDDFYAKIKDNYGLEVLITMVDLYVLENEFPDKVEDGKAYASSYIDGLIESNGGEQALLSLIQANTNYSTIEAYEEYLYLSYLQSYAIEVYAEEIVTDEQIEKYYDEEAKGDIEISHILIVPDAAVGATDDEIAEAEEAAKEIIENDIIAALEKADKNGEDIEEVFAELVKEYSEDEATLEKDGSLGKINYFVLDSSYDELIDAGYELKVGEFSTEVITTSQGFHVILKTAAHDKESLEDLTDDIKGIIADDNLATITTISIDALEHYREKYEVNIIDSELSKQYNNSIEAMYAAINSSELQ